MKKLYIGMLFGVFFLASFMALNFVTSTSFPGYGGNKECNYCHNQPALVKDVSGANATFTMGNIAQAQKVFDENNVQWARDEVPTIQTNNRSEANLDFVSMTFIRNSTDLMVQANVPDNTVNNTSPATSDKFGIIFDIDVVNFSVGQFLTAYTNGQPLSTTLSGQMGFSQGGHADFWFVDTSVVKANTTGMANDEYISTGILTDSQQDVHVMVWYGNGGHGMQYQYYFVRPLNTGDKNDAQFDVAGTPIYYAIAHWDASLTVYHDSSFDQMVVVGNSVSGITARTTTETNVQTETKTETTTTTVSGTTTTTGTTSSFTAVFVLAGLVVSIPLISHMRRRKH